MLSIGAVGSGLPLSALFHGKGPRKGTKLGIQRQGRTLMLRIAFLQNLLLEACGFGLGHRADAQG